MSLGLGHPQVTGIVIKYTKYVFRAPKVTGIVVKYTTHVFRAPTHVFRALIITKYGGAMAKFPETSLFLPSSKKNHVNLEINNYQMNNLKTNKGY